MGNCLKTQLKESVNNNNLVHFGEIHVHVNSTNSIILDNYLFSIADSGIDLEIIGDAHFTNSAGTSDLGKTRENYKGNFSNVTCITAGEYTLIIKDKYKVAKYFFDSGKKYSVLTDELYGIESLTSLSVQSLNNGFNIEKAANNIFKSLTSYGNLFGTISPSQVEEIVNVFLVDNNNLQGSIIDFANPALTDVRIVSNSLTACTMEEFVQKIITAQIAAGDSPSGTFNYQGNQMTLGSSHAYESQVRKISWTEHKIQALNSSNQVIQEVSI